MDAYYGDYKKRPLSFNETKRSVIRAAKELRYGKDILDKLEKATTENELAFIMTTARRKE